MEDISINPYQLLGVTIYSSLTELRQNYYKLALLCHPDKGGDKNDMIMLHNSYLYIKHQLEHSSNEPVEDIENNFKDFFSQNKEQIPSYYEIWKNTDECKSLEQFNQQFENNKLTGTIKPFQDGYGKFMESKDLTLDNEIYDICKQLFSHRQIIKNIMEFITKVKHEFKTDLIIYKEPVGFGSDYGSVERFDVDKVTDFSQSIDNLNMTDYQLAFGGHHKISDNYLYKRPKSLEELLKERENIY